MPPGSTHSKARNLESRSRIFNGGPPSSSSLVRTDGADGADQRILHRNELLSSSTALGTLKSAWMKVTPISFHSPKQIANEIRRLRGHDKSTVYQRHKKFNDGDHSCSNSDDLVPLCTRLFLLKVIETDDNMREAIQNEFLKLYAEDPVIYDLCRRVIASKMGNIVNPYTKEIEDCHRRWSKLLGRSSFGTDEHSETAQSNCNVLKETFDRFKQNDQGAIEYIPYAMALKVQNEDLELLRQLWDYFLDCMEYGMHEEELWVRNMELCFEKIVSSAKPFAYFASPLQLRRIASTLGLNAPELPFIFSTFFATPKIVSRGPRYSPYDAAFVYNSLAGSWDIVTASNYAIFIEDDLRTYFRTQIPKPSVFFQSTISDLYRITKDAALNYRGVAGVLSNGKLEASIYLAIVALVEPSLKSVAITSSSGKDKKDRDVPRNNFYIAHTVDIDRYHKHEMLEKFKENDAYIEVLNDRLRFQTFLREPGGVCNLTYIPQLQNVSYLRRFKIGQKYFITADGLPEVNNRILKSWNQSNFPKGVTVYTMLLSWHVLTCLRVCRESPIFRCTGHYPVLAGVDLETGEPLYVAVVRPTREVAAPWYFTPVKDGASSATYTDEVGKEYISYEFFVLALRHDPTDLPPQDIQHRAGAKDPTGPVYWVEFWPRKDARYFSDERLRDDRRLELFMDDLRERKIAESVLDGFV